MWMSCLDILWMQMLVSRKRGYKYEMIPQSITTSVDNSSMLTSLIIVLPYSMMDFSTACCNPSLHQSWKSLWYTMTKKQTDHPNRCDSLGILYTNGNLTTYTVYGDKNCRKKQPSLVPVTYRVESISQNQRAGVLKPPSWKSSSHRKWK